MINYYEASTFDKYNSIPIKDPMGLYFIVETGQIYKGNKHYGGAVEFVDDFPVAPAQGRIYIKNDTKEGKVFIGTEWKTVIESIATALTDETPVTSAVAGDAVKTYVTDKVTAAVKDLVKNVVYNDTTKTFTVTAGETPTQYSLNGFFTGASYNGETGELSFTVQGTAEPIKISLPKDNLITGGTYDEANKQVVLTLSNGGTIDIPAVDLVNVSSFTGTSTVLVGETVNGSAPLSVKISATEGNKLVVNEDGLYVDPTPVDVSGKLDKVATEKADELISANADGTVKTTGYKIGGATVADTGNETIIATEAALNAALEKALTWNIIE